MDDRNHTREHTFPAVVRLLSDGCWHQRQDLSAVTTFPEEWLVELEREGYELERQDGRVRLFRAAS